MQVASVEARVWVGGQGCGLALGVLRSVQDMGLAVQPGSLALVFLSIATGCTLQATSHLSSFSELSAAGGVIRG